MSTRKISVRDKKTAQYTVNSDRPAAIRLRRLVWTLSGRDAESRPARVARMPVHKRLFTDTDLLSGAPDDAQRAYRRVARRILEL